jgi:aryl-alcohol dehydrogenase-like predicted oxidoreductase
MLIPGYATPEGTARFRERFAARLPGHFREAQGLWISSIGSGTYLGEPTAACDALYRDAITQAVEGGINVLDTAVNYRHQRSERSIAQALAALLSEGAAQRDELVLATKGGFLSGDGEEPKDPAAYFQEKLIDTGVVRVDEIAAECHVISPKYLENQIEVSRRNLGVETLDIYYLHNPETQLTQVSRDEFYRRLKAAFAALEKAVTEGKICMYGTATWNAYRVGPESRDALSLSEVLRAAEEVGGRDHHFHAIQLPFNLAMPEALTATTQRLEGKPVPLLQVARTHGLMVFASASLLQSQLSSGLPPEVQTWFPGLQTDAQRAIQFVRSAPGITCALVGMRRREHVAENLHTAAAPPLTLEKFRAILTGGARGRARRRN